MPLLKVSLHQKHRRNIMCMGGGQSVAPPPAKTLAQIQAATDNPYENPGSGTATPQWKLAVKTSLFFFQSGVASPEPGFS